MSDRELISAAQAGDADAFGQLVVRYQRAAYGHAMSLLGNREETRDAMQDSFLAAFRALRGLDRNRPFFPWFYVILRNRCLSILRRFALVAAGILLIKCLDVLGVFGEGTAGRLIVAVGAVLLFTLLEVNPFRIICPEELPALPASQEGAKHGKS